MPKQDWISKLNELHPNDDRDTNRDIVESMIAFLSERGLGDAFIKYLGNNPTLTMQK